MNKNQKKVIDYIIMVIFYAIFLPFVILYGITYSINVFMKYAFEKWLNPYIKKHVKLCVGQYLIQLFI